MLAPTNVKVAPRRHPYVLLPQGGGGALRRMRAAGMPVRPRLQQVASEQIEVFCELLSKRSINHVRQDKVCFQEAGAGEQFHGSSAS
jgi:hypothetical protein